MILNDVFSDIDSIQLKLPIMSTIIALLKYDVINYSSGFSNRIVKSWEKDNLVFILECFRGRLDRVQWFCVVFELVDVTLYHRKPWEHRIGSRFIINKEKETRWIFLLLWIYYLTRAKFLLLVKNHSCMSSFHSHWDFNEKLMLYGKKVSQFIKSSDQTLIYIHFCG